MSVDEEIFKKLQLEKKAIKMPYHLSKFSSSQENQKCRVHMFYGHYLADLV
jgi:hypothetical protein